MTETADRPGLPPDPWVHLELWDQQPGETPLQYRHFIVYRDLGRTRSVPAAARRVERAHTTLQKIAWSQRWVERATAWDHEEDRVFRETMVVQRRTVAEQHLTIARAMLAKAVARIQNLKVSDMSAREVAQFVETAVKIQRLALGDSTENVAHVPVSPGAAEFANLTEAEQDQRLAEVHREIARRLASQEPASA